MKTLASTLLIAVVALALTTGSPELLAQGKKGSTSKSGTIELIQSKDGKYRFSIRDADGKYLAGSPVGHDTEKEAREAVEELKSVIGTARYVSKKSDAKDEKGKEK